MGANVPGQLSPDGAYYWDGAQWVTTLSKDGAHRWNGSAWIPAGGPTAPAGPPSPPAAAAGYAAAPAARPATGLGYQFGGVAGWSIVVGLVSMAVPIVTGLTTGTSTYFLVLPLFGIYRGFVAIRLGRTAGGAVGIALSILGGLISLALLLGR
jgi:hypothetical protein